MCQDKVDKKQYLDQWSNPQYIYLILKTKTTSPKPTALFLVNASSPFLNSEAFSACVGNYTAVLPGAQKGEKIQNKREG